MTWKPLVNLISVLFYKRIFAWIERNAGPGRGSVLPCGTLLPPRVRGRLFEKKSSQPHVIVTPVRA